MGCLLLSQSCYRHASPLGRQLFFVFPPFVFERAAKPRMGAIWSPLRCWFGLVWLVATDEVKMGTGQKRDTFLPTLLYLSFKGTPWPFLMEDISLAFISLGGQATFYLDALLTAPGWKMTTSVAGSQGENPSGW